VLDLVGRLAVNYAYVLVGIGAFAAPFYGLYRRRYVPDGQVRVSFSRHLELFFESRYANWLVFAWALGEAVVWFVIPEFLLLLLVFMRNQRKGELLVYDIAGTAVGAVAAYFIHLPVSAIIRLPYIQPNMVRQVQHWYDHFGVWGLAFQPFSGVPFKVFTHLAAGYHFWLVGFVAVAVAFRISRYYISYAIFNAIFPFLHARVYRNYVPLFFVATFIFSVLLLRVWSIFGPGYRVG
jgi:hypothetical protein